MADTVAILLSAGESRRMGSPKALLLWQGTTLLDHQVSALLEGGADRVVVVLGHQAESLKPIIEGRHRVNWVVNPHYAQGKTTSIKVGLNQLSLKALGDEEPVAILILNVDQPRSSATIRGLLQRHRAYSGLITIPTYRGKGGHPIAIDPSLLPELSAITEETLGVKAVVQAHADSTNRTEMSTAEVLWDLNTPEEYEEALRSSG